MAEGQAGGRAGRCIGHSVAVSYCFFKMENGVLLSFLLLTHLCGCLPRCILYGSQVSSILFLF